MKQTTVYLPEEIDNSLNRLAQTTGRTQAELIQEAIQQYLLCTNQPLPQCVKMGASGMRNLSKRDEELLWQEDRRHFNLIQPEKVEYHRTATLAIKLGFGIESKSDRSFSFWRS